MDPDICLPAWDRLKSLMKLMVVDPVVSLRPYKLNSGISRDAK
jgi:hypothetical protein